MEIKIAIMHCAWQSNLTLYSEGMEHWQEIPLKGEDVELIVASNISLYHG